MRGGEIIGPLSDVEVLAIDELGKGRGSPFEMETLVRSLVVRVTELELGSADAWRCLGRALQAAEQR